MNPLYHQLSGVIGVALVLGLVGILCAVLERLDRETPSFQGPMGTIQVAFEEEGLRRAEEISGRRSGAETEDAAQHDLEHK